MLASINIRDHMLQNPVTIKPDATLEDAVVSILRHKISGLCVVDNDKNLLGVLSEMDCLRAFMDATYNRSGFGKVEEYMTCEVDTVRLQDDLITVANDMLAKNQRRRPVVDDGKLIGQITCRSLLAVVETFSRSVKSA